MTVSLFANQVFDEESFQRIAPTLKALSSLKAESIRFLPITFYAYTRSSLHNTQSRVFYKVGSTCCGGYPAGSTIKLYSDSKSDQLSEEEKESSGTGFYDNVLAKLFPSFKKDS